MFVCSKGKREYIQLLWLMLDPRGELIPESGAPGPRRRAAACRRAWHEGWGAAPRAGRARAAGEGCSLRRRWPRLGPCAGWRVRRRTRLAGGGARPAQPPHSLPPSLRSAADWDARLTSTFPDTLGQAANKSALTALGCYDVTKPHVPTQVALPMMCLDDSVGQCAARGPGLPVGGWQCGRGRRDGGPRAAAGRPAAPSPPEPRPCRAPASSSPTVSHPATLAPHAEAYEPEYEHCVMYCAEYRPSDLLEADDGELLLPPLPPLPLPDGRAPRA